MRLLCGMRRMTCATTSPKKVDLGNRTIRMPSATSCEDGIAYVELHMRGGKRGHAPAVPPQHGVILAGRRWRIRSRRRTPRPSSLPVRDAMLGRARTVWERRNDAGKATC
jgi:hypothetical protein